MDRLDNWVRLPSRLAYDRLIFTWYHEVMPAFSNLPKQCNLVQPLPGWCCRQRGACGLHDGSIHRNSSSTRQRPVELVELVEVQVELVMEVKQSVDQLQRSFKSLLAGHHHMQGSGALIKCCAASAAKATYMVESLDSLKICSYNLWQNSCFLENIGQPADCWGQLSTPPAWSPCLELKEGELCFLWLLGIFLQLHMSVNCLDSSSNDCDILKIDAQNGCWWM